MADARTKRRLAWIGIPVVLLVLLVVFWNWDWLIPIVQSRASAAIGRPVTITHLHVRPGRITADMDATLFAFVWAASRWYAMNARRSHPRVNSTRHRARLRGPARRPLWRQHGEASSPDWNPQTYLRVRISAFKRQLSRGTNVSSLEEIT
jgi:hypothetical protein